MTDRLCAVVCCPAVLSPLLYPSSLCPCILSWTELTVGVHEGWEG